MLKHSVELRHCLLCGCVAACCSQLVKKYPHFMELERSLPRF